MNDNCPVATSRSHVPISTRHHTTVEASISRPPHLLDSDQIFDNRIRMERNIVLSLSKSESALEQSSASLAMHVVARETRRTPGKVDTMKEIDHILNILEYEQNVTYMLQSLKKEINIRFEEINIRNALYRVLEDETMTYDELLEYTSRLLLDHKKLVQVKRTLANLYGIPSPKGESDPIMSVAGVLFRKLYTNTSVFKKQLKDRLQIMDKNDWGYDALVEEHRLVGRLQRLQKSCELAETSLY